MAMQGRTDQKVFPFWLSGDTFARDNETLQQDAARAAVLKTFTLMGLARVAVAAAGVADAANAAGTGTLTAAALVSGILPRVGTWEIECVATEVHGGTFKLTDPGGNIVRNDLKMIAGAGAATVFYIPEVGLKFTITDGATDFIATEKFTLAVTAVNKWVPFDPSAVNGAQVPAGIFIGDEVAAAKLVAGDVTGQPVIVRGVGGYFDSSLLVIEGTATLTTVLAGGKSVREALYDLGFFAYGTVDVNNLENT